mmetsp:Transcript_63148/g.131312  ORF Transcript_63148/g.131312 Transcript_63148/m.131312 type:complete len:309 (-) Transcript_63148:2-928(-)
MGEEGDDADAVPVLGTLLLKHFRGGDLRDGLGGARGFEMVCNERNDVRCGTAAIVVMRLLLPALACLEQLDGGVALHAIRGRKPRLLRGIHHAELEVSLQLLRRVLPLRLQPLAVPAPRRHELHQPVLRALQHLGVEICFSKVDCSLLSSAAAAATSAARLAAAGWLASKLLCDLVREHFQSMLSNGGCRPLPLVVLWLVLVGAKKLDGGKPLHSVLPSELLVLVRIHLSHLDRRSNRPRQLAPIGKQRLAVPAPGSIEQHCPDIIAVQNLLLEIRRRQLLTLLSRVREACERQDDENEQRVGLHCAH